MWTVCSGSVGSGGLGWDWLRAVRFVMAVLVRFGVFGSGPAVLGDICCGEHGGRSCGFPTNLN